MNVAIVGASGDPTKYANRAMHMLESHRHTVFLVNPNHEMIDGKKVYSCVSDIPETIDTVTLYVRPSIGASMADDITAAKPRRVIMNPGTVSEGLASKLQENNVEVVRGCTLVMLQTGMF